MGRAFSESYDQILQYYKSSMDEIDYMNNISFSHLSLVLRECDLDVCAQGSRHRIMTHATSILRRYPPLTQHL